MKKRHSLRFAIFSRSENWKICDSDLVAGQVRFATYPNPAGNQITLETNLSEDAIYELRDAWGRLIQQGMVQQRQSLDLRSLPDGMYFLRLRYADGREIGVEKIVKRPLGYGLDRKVVYLSGGILTWSEGC